MFYFITLIVAVAVAATSAEYVRMEPTVNTFSSSNWLKEKSLKDTDMVKAVFVLKHEDSKVRAFEKNLIDISTPSSPNYGKWMKPDEIIKAISPAESNVKIVTDYLAKFGITGRVSKFRDMIHVTMPVKTANEMLQTEFALFRSVSDRNVVLPRITKGYSLPSEVAKVVSIVDDIMRFPALRNSPKSYGLDSTPLKRDDDEFGACGTKCNGYTTPAVLEAAYSYSSPVANVAAGNSMSVAEFQLQYWDQADLTAFNKACDTDASVHDTIGGNNERICSVGGCVEALLDIEYIGAVANPIPLTVLYSADYSLLDWVDQVMALENPPLVHSVSYGNDEVQQTSNEYMQSVNVEFMTAGSMGLSILFASGDQGVWGRSGVGATYHPDFPAGSPYVTAVGGTDFATKGSIGEETAWSCGGGGFSDAFARPSWQEDAVSTYLSKAAAAGILPSSEYFNASGRAYPDVSALGGQVNPYCVAVKGGSDFGGVAGTSASCPVVAGIFAQLNNVRLSAGKSPLGFLNPLIYANPQCFNDIKDGSMNNCNRGTTGFSTTVGWDAATGHGSPNYACLAKVV